MDVTAFVVRLAFLSLPGIIAWLLYRSFVGKSSGKDWEDFIEVLLFTIASYTLLVAAFEATRALGVQSQQSIVIDAFSDETIPIPWTEVAFSSLIGVGLALLVAYAQKNTIISNLGRRLRVRIRAGDGDVWERFLRNEGSGWIMVHDHEVGLGYFGWLKSYSHSGQKRELLLEDVDVYEGEPSVKKYSVHYLYVAREDAKLTVQVLNDLGPDTDQRRAPQPGRTNTHRSAIEDHALLSQLIHQEEVSNGDKARHTARQ